jgi:hypothetical protein
VVAKTFKSRGRTEYPKHVFITKVHQITLSRRRQRDNRFVGATSSRLPVFRVLGPSAADAAQSVKPKLDREIEGIGKTLEKNILSQIDRVLKRSRK